MARTDYSIVDNAMTTAWEHADVFPIIARIIDTESVESGGAYVTHDQITSSLLTDTEGSTLSSAARGNSTRIVLRSGSLTTWLRGSGNELRLASPIGLNDSIARGSAANGRTVRNQPFREGRSPNADLPFVPFRSTIFS